MPVADILLVVSFASENWCCHILSKYDKSFWRNQENAVLSTTDGTAI